MTKKEQLLIIGAGPFAENIADMAEHCGYEIAGFVINQNRSHCEKTLLGKRIYWIDEIAELSVRCKAVCAIGTTFRDEIIGRISNLGFTFATLISPSAMVSERCQIQEGTIVCEGAVIATRGNIGKHVIVNRGSLVGHHVQVGDFSTLSPGVNIGGSSQLAEKVYVGMGAIIRDKCTIGPKSVVGAGAVVVKDVPACVQVTGLPAKVTRKNIDGI